MPPEEYFFAVTANAGPIAPVAPGTGFHLGRTDAAPDANTSHEGFLDDVRVYDEILTLEQLEMVRMEGLMATPSPTIPGDYNDNGRVEQADLDLVLLNWNEPVENLPADWVNERPTSGIIDQAELDGVLLNWNRTTPGLGTAAAVPEPAGWLLAALAATLAVVPSAGRRKPRRQAIEMAKEYCRTLRTVPGIYSAPSSRTSTTR